MLFIYTVIPTALAVMTPNCELLGWRQQSHPGNAHVAPRIHSPGFKYALRMRPCGGSIVPSEPAALAGFPSQRVS